MIHPPSPWLTLQELLVPFSILKHSINRKKKTPKKTLTPCPVIVIPGLGSSDSSTASLRKHLSGLGLRVFKGGIGRNNGDVKKLVIKASGHLDAVFEEAKESVVVIGWSLGGIIARELARQHPQKVRAVCTMGSPIIGGGKYSAYAPIYKRMGYDLDKMEHLCNRREESPIQVPALSLYSKKDGIVFWKASIDRFNDHTDHIEVNCGHFSMGFSSDVFEALESWIAKMLV